MSNRLTLYTVAPCFESKSLQIIICMHRVNRHPKLSISTLKVRSSVRCFIPTNNAVTRRRSSALGKVIGGCFGGEHLGEGGSVASRCSSASGDNVWFNVRSNARCLRPDGMDEDLRCSVYSNLALRRGRCNVLGLATRVVGAVGGLRSGVGDCLVGLRRRLLLLGGVYRGILGFGFDFVVRRSRLLGSSGFEHNVDLGRSIIFPLGRLPWRSRGLDSVPSVPHAIVVVRSRRSVRNDGRSRQQSDRLALAVNLRRNDGLRDVGDISSHGDIGTVAFLAQGGGACGRLSRW